MSKCKAIAIEMMVQGSGARREAEIMMGLRFEDMTHEERMIAAEVLAAFENEWRV